MKRWSLLLLLLLLPLTMAPRTSFDPQTLDITIGVSTPRSAVRLGSAIPVSVDITNNDVTEPTEALQLVVTALVSDVKDAAVVRSASPNCVGIGSAAGCSIPALDPGETTTMRLIVWPTTAGALTFNFMVRGGVELGVTESLVDVR